MNKKQLIISLLSLLIYSTGLAQEVEMADNFRGEGKIFVVVGVIVVLLIGLFIQLFRLEKKVKVLEKEFKD